LKNIIEIKVNNNWEFSQKKYIDKSFHAMFKKVYCKYATEGFPEIRLDTSYMTKLLEILCISVNELFPFLTEMN